jgi:hypothetical protein
LRIVVTSGRHAFACLLLAAAHPGPVSVDIAPMVARNVTELVQVIERHLPAPLPWQLEARRDERAANNVMVEKLVEQVVEETSKVDQEPQMPEAAVLHKPIIDLELESIWLEPITDRPSEQAKPTLPKPPPRRVAPRGLPLLPALMRGTIKDCVAARAGFEVLQRALAPTAENRIEVAARIVQIAGADSPMARMISALMPEKPARSGGWIAMDEADFPTTLRALAAEDDMPIWDLWRLRIDLSLMGLSSSVFRTAMLKQQQPIMDDDTEPPTFGL